MADNKARPKITGNHSFEIMFADNPMGRLNYADANAPALS